MSLLKLNSYLKQNNEKVCCAESLTSGHIQAILGSQTGSSVTFSGGVTAYNLKQKVSILGVNEAHARQCDCVSEQVAIEMGIGALRLFGEDGAGVAISTTGYIEPYPREGITRPHAYICVVFRTRECEVKKVDIPEDISREEAQKEIANQAIEFCSECVHKRKDMMRVFY